MASIRSVWENGWAPWDPSGERNTQAPCDQWKWEMSSIRSEGGKMGSMRSMEVRSVGRFYILYIQSPFNGLSS